MNFDVNQIQEAPAVQSGVIRLAPFIGCACLVEVTGERFSKKTRFGERDALPAKIHTADATTEGVLYSASIAGGMKPGNVYHGRLRRDGMGYAMDPLTRDELQKLVQAVKARGDASAAGSGKKK